MSTNENPSCKCTNHNPQNMICPLQVRSPQSRFINIEEILVNNGPEGFSLAWLKWDDAENGQVEKVLGIRWNGYLDADGNLNKGHPVVRGYPTWFIVPVELEKLLLSNHDYLINIPLRISKSSNP